MIVIYLYIMSEFTCYYYV